MRDPREQLVAAHPDQRTEVRDVAGNPVFAQGCVQVSACAALLSINVPSTSNKNTDTSATLCRFLNDKVKLRWSSLLLSQWGGGTHKSDRAVPCRT